MYKYGMKFKKEEFKSSWTGYFLKKKTFYENDSFFFNSLAVCVCVSVGCVC